MEISNQRLKQVIMEEIKKVLTEEAMVSTGNPDKPKERWTVNDGDIVKRQNDDTTYRVTTCWMERGKPRVRARVCNPKTGAFWSVETETIAEEKSDVLILVKKRPPEGWES